MTTEADKCIFIPCPKGKWYINKYLKPYGAIYNGIGWFIEEKHRPIAEEVCKEAELHAIPWPLEGKSFDDMANENKESYFHVCVAKLDQKIMELCSTLGLDMDDSDSLMQIRDELDKKPEGQELLECIDKRDSFRNNISKIEIEKKLSGALEIPSIMSMGDRIAHLDETLKRYRGEKYLGLKVTSFPEINECLLGLRKLILLAAAPNVGKTALTIQLAIEVLQEQKNACLVYVSLEMTAEEIFTRMNLYLSGMTYRKYVLGSERIEGDTVGQSLFDEDEWQRMQNATSTLKEIGNRLQIVDSSTTVSISADSINKYVDRIKEQTGCDRAIVVIDYLQVWPTPTSQKFMSEIDTDKWRVGEMKKIRDKLNEGKQNPLIVISEARKPANDAAWGSDMSDVMGTARCTYTPDAVMLLSVPRPATLEKMWNKYSLTKIKFIEDAYEESDNERNAGDKEGIAIIEFLARHGMAVCRVKVCKGRDGMQRFNSTMIFNFWKNIFVPIEKAWAEIKNLQKQEENKKNG